MFSLQSFALQSWFTLSTLQPSLADMDMVKVILTAMASLYIAGLCRDFWGILTRSIKPEQFTIAMVCPMSIKFTAAVAMLDQKFDHLVLPLLYDSNSYIYGRIGGHNVVVVCLPGPGKVKASEAGVQLRNDFPNLRLAILVGVAGGLPSPRQDIRLRDVVIATKIVVHDHGRWENQSFRPNRSSVKESNLAKCTIAKLESKYSIHYFDLEQNCTELLHHNPHLERKYCRPVDSVDELYQRDYHHTDNETDNCKSCNKTKLQIRRERPFNRPQVHFDPIGSGDAVFRSAEKSFLLAQKKMLCVEMEAAGIADKLPCIVVRGICDYADSPKNKVLQPNAALLAAIVAKDLLLSIPPRANSF